MRTGGLWRRLAMVLAALVATTLVAAGCGTVGGSNNAGGNDNQKTQEKGSGNGSGSGSNGKTIKIGWIPWDEDVVTTRLWKQALEKKGYKVEMVQLDPGPLFAGLSKGDVDLFLDAWLPTTHAKYWKQYGNKLEDLGVWYDNATLGITVPNYVKDVKTIGDLKKHADEFDGKITGIEAGAGLTDTTENKVMPAYGLDNFKLVKSSTPAMLTELQKAIKAKEPIVVTLWRPHWAYAKLPIHDLKDPKGSLGKAEKLHAIGREGFGKDFPEVKKWMADFQMNDKQLGTLEDVALNQNKDNPDKGVSDWAKDNADFVDGLTK